jgi:3-dehydrotetronate 4-kinase
MKPGTTSPLLLGAIADDFTGATDLAGMLVGAGMHTLQTIGVPKRLDARGQWDAIVIALKSRNIPACEAAAQSLVALSWLRARGATQIYFKYCSTFDSTPAGNIGPVADALLDALDAHFTVACPAYPANGRTIYKGHLFVGDALLSDSAMRDHPLTPMRDANLVRVLGRQTPRKVGLVAWDTVCRGPRAIGEEFERLQRAGVTYAVVDAIDDRNLLDIGAACATLQLVTAGSGIALGLPQNFRAAGALPERSDAARMPTVPGKSAVLAGSCWAATRAQVAAFARHHAASEMVFSEGDTAETIATRALSAVDAALASGEPFLVYSTADPAHVAAIQARLGRERAASLIEGAFGLLARELVVRGVRRLVVAGGETAGAVVQALDVEALEIGPMIDPGVPWTTALGQQSLALALKSGNFGSENFFEKALAMLPASVEVHP